MPTSRPIPRRMAQPRHSCSAWWRLAPSPGLPSPSPSRTADAKRRVGRPGGFGPRGPCLLGHALEEGRWQSVAGLDDFRAHRPLLGHSSALSDNGFLSDAREMVTTPLGHPMRARSPGLGDDGQAEAERCFACPSFELNEAPHPHAHPRITSNHTCRSVLPYPIRCRIRPAGPYGVVGGFDGATVGLRLGLPAGRR